MATGHLPARLRERFAGWNICGAADINLIAADETDRPAAKMAQTAGTDVEDAMNTIGELPLRDNPEKAKPPESA